MYKMGSGVCYHLSHCLRVSLGLSLFHYSVLALFSISFLSFPCLYYLVLARLDLISVFGVLNIPHFSPTYCTDISLRLVLIPTYKSQSCSASVHITLSRGTFRDSALEKRS